MAPQYFCEKFVLKRSI